MKQCRYLKAPDHSECFHILADFYPEDGGSIPLRNVGTHHQTTWYHNSEGYNMNQYRYLKGT